MGARVLQEPMPNQGTQQNQQQLHVQLHETVNMGAPQSGVQVTVKNTFLEAFEQPQLQVQQQQLQLQVPQMEQQLLQFQHQELQLPQLQQQQLLQREAVTQVVDEHPRPCESSDERCSIQIHGGDPKHEHHKRLRFRMGVGNALLR